MSRGNVVGSWKRELTIRGSRWRFVYTRKCSSPMGRFGGGWDWQVGAQWTDDTVIFNLLIAYLRVSRTRL